MANTFKCTKQGRIAAWGGGEVGLRDSHRTRGIFDVSSEDTEYVKVISGARSKLEECVVLSMPRILKNECSVKPHAMPIFNFSEKTKALNVSKSARTEETQKHMDHISEKDTCPSCTRVYGA